MNDIMVSIICNTYNHERYVKDALDGFLNQKTNFPFEVLIHDDASTDRTQEIIKEYTEKYPEIIKPILQTQNQRSLGKSPTYYYQLPRVQGKYIAFCEGDDYWIDSNKLQKQIDALEKYPNVDICAHASQRMDAETGQVIRISSKSDKITVIPTEDVIKGGGGFVASASIVYRKELADNMPPFHRMIMLDYSMQVHGALRGGMLYLPDVMCVYRINTTSSVTRMMRENPKRKAKYKDRTFKMMVQLDKDTNKKYHAIIMKQLLENRVSKIGILLQAFFQPKVRNIK